MVEGEPRAGSSTGCQAVSSGSCGSTPAGTMPTNAVASSRRCGIAAGLAPRAELLEVRDFADVDLGREVAADRGLERLVRLERAARERPGAGVGLARALPEQRLQPALAHLEHDRERDLRRRGCGRIRPRFVPHSLKPNGKALLMRRLLPLALLLSLVVLAGCGGSDDEAGQTTAAATSARRQPIRVGLITDQGQLDDNGFNELAFRGLTRAEKELGIKGRVVESASAADYIPNMTRLARDGYDLVIGVGFAQGDAIGKVAQKYPDVGFAIIDVDQAFVPGKPANVQGLLFREQEVGYLVGYLAGPRGEAAHRRRRDQRRRRHEGAAGRPVRRRLLRRRREGRPRDQDAARLLTGLGRPGEVQGAGAEPDRARLERRLPGRRRLRPRCAERGGRARSLGHRRRRRPVVPRPAHPHERAEGGRRGGLPHDQGGPGRHLEGRRQRDLRPRRRKVSGSAR